MNNRSINVGGNFTGAANLGDDANVQVGNIQHNPSGQEWDSVVLEAREILNNLEKKHSSSTTAGKFSMVSDAIEVVENNSSLTKRILSALKSGGAKAFEKAIDHPVASFFVAALEDWQKTHSA